MDSPESSKPTTTTATATIDCETAPAQDSPVFNFLSNLSPIQPVKAPSVAQGFPELNSPPLVFTSPRLNPQRRSTFLKRSYICWINNKLPFFWLPSFHCKRILEELFDDVNLSRAHFPRAPGAKFAGQDENGKNGVATVKGCEKLNIQLSTRLEKGTDSNSPENDLAGSPAGCPEQFLTDIVDVDSADTKLSNNSTCAKSEFIDQLPDVRTDSKQNLVALECETNSRTSEQIETEEVLEGITSIDVSTVEKDTKQIDSVPFDHCPVIEHELHVGHALANRTEEDSMTENVEAKQAAQSDQSHRLLSGSSDVGKYNEMFVAQANESALAEPVLRKVQIDNEAFQHRGVRRRCLQFEDAHHKVISNQIAQSTSDSEGLRPLPLETTSIPIHGKLDEVIQPVLSPRNCLNSTVKIPKPSGIGLHLNSIVNAVQAGPGSKINVKSAQSGNFSIVGKKSMHTNDYSHSSSISPVVENASACTAGNMHERHASAGVASPMSLSAYVVKPSNKSIALNSIRDKSTSGNKRKCIEKVGGPEELNNSSPQKKRMKLLDHSDGDGCKRCNCKKSKCLKLYCDCFAAGIYCADPCACQVCLNRPEYEGTVIETRQKIESRDPLAFAPKVVQRITEQPLNSCGEAGTNFTPSSARHKRGCTCKKSMCLKKYCECYQANVGCSYGCRCEGCQNVFGRKGEYCPIKDVFSEEETNITVDGSILEKCEITASGNRINHAEVFNAHSLTPPTPAFHFSNHGKDASKVWFPCGEFSESPESSFTYVAPYMISPRSPINSDNNGMITEDPQEINILDLASFESWTENSMSQSFSVKGPHYPPGGSLVWRGSPNTPVPQFSGTKLLWELELSNSVQDDTPEILKESPTPLNGVKVCSPNKKRVSPPHGRPHESGSGSSMGLRTGRKFILKAVPSFPPLTPCIDSRTVSIQQANYPQDCNVNK
ncbi:hypothetical protein OROHE_009308 [Orobanche hederae]